MRIVIGDLVHRAITLSIDSFPYAAGLLSAYIQKYSEVSLEVSVHRFFEPFLADLRETKPDIIALTNYSWNCRLSHHAAKVARALWPDALLVVGGPNMPADLKTQKEFFASLFPFDLAVIGEGEQVFLQVVQEFESHGRMRTRFLADADISSTLRRRINGEIEAGSGIKPKRIVDLDSIPSPYLSGVMDSFFNQGLYPILQTNRGCPFTCTFCLEGTDYYSKVNKFSMERVQEELLYIAKRCKPSDVLFIADSNFGMYRRDIDIATFLSQLQKDYSWPKFINCTTGKNSPGTVIQAVDLLNGALEISSSVQSLNADTLTHVRRENIHLSAYAEIQTAIRSRGLRSMADLILCLPGETRESHFEGIRQLLDSGVQRILPYQLMLLNGTQLNTPESREKFSFLTRHRIVARNFGEYEGEPVFETEEIVVGTNTLPFNDYLACRQLHLILEIYLKQEPFREIFVLLETHGVKRSELIFTLYEMREGMPQQLAELCSEFLQATQDELFVTEAAVRDYLQGNFSKLKQEQVGANLLQKYSVTGWFHCLNSVIDYLVQVATTLIHRNSKSADTGSVVKQIEDLGNYLRAVYINVLAAEDLHAARTVSLSYDVAGWIADGFSQDLQNYQLVTSDAHGGVSPCTRDFVMKLPEERKSLLQEKLQKFGSSKSGLGKMLTRIYFQDIRREILSS